MRNFIYKIALLTSTIILIYTINFWLKLTLGLENSLLKIPIIDREFNSEISFYRNRPACPEFQDTSVLLNLKTDRFGLVNDSNIYHPDIVVIGDSYAHGAYLGIGNTLSSKIGEKLADKTVMNLGITSYSDLRFYNYLVSRKSIKEPKVIILEIIERNLLHWNNLNYTKEYSPLYDRISRVISTNYKGVFSDNKSQCNLAQRYFYRKKLIEIESKEIQLLSNKLLEIQTEFAKKNIDIYFLVIPDPENAFREELHLSGRSVVDDFNLISLGLGLNTIDIVSLMRDNRETYYLYDDSHWSSAGVEAVADHIVTNLLY